MLPSCPFLVILVIALVLVSSGWLASLADADEPTKPFLIGALTESWGLTPEIVGL